MIKTALIGYGYSARTFHLPLIANEAALQLVAISSSQSAAAIAYPHLKHYQDAPSLIMHSDARLVVITSPNQSHFALAKLALQMGKDVLLEKPFVLSLAQGIELQQLAVRQQCQLAVYHNRRFDGDFLTLQQLIKQQTLGDIRFFASHFDRFRPEPRIRWREQAGPGSGILWDLGPHLIDQALVLFGAPQAITAQCRILRPGGESTDFFQLQLHYADKEVLLQSSPFCANLTPRFMLQGSLGSYQKSGLDPQEDALRAGQTPGGAAWGQDDPALFGELATAQQRRRLPTLAGDYPQFYRQFVRALQGQADLPVPLQDALLGIQLIELAERSAVLGQRLVVEQVDCSVKLKV